MALMSSGEGTHDRFRLEVGVAKGGDLPEQPRLLGLRFLMRSALV